MRRMAVLVVGWAVALGCSGAEGDGNPGGTGGAAAGSSGGAGGSAAGTGSGGSGAGTACFSDTDCAAPERCGGASRRCFAPGACALDGDCDSGQRCDAGACVIGGGCGQTEFETTRLQPNMMILLDRSGSMSADDAGGDTRWNVAKAAIRTVTEGFDDRIRFGLATYSSCQAGGCSAGTIVVPIADAAAPAINGYLADKLDSGSNDGNGTVSGGVAYLCDSGDPETSTGKSLDALVGEPTLQDPARDNLVLLLTDGAESDACVDNGVNGPVGAANLLGQAQPVRTYVVGLNVGQAAIEDIAVAGGTTAPLPASDQATLAAALQQIAAAVVTCEYALGSTPADLDQLHVFFNDATPGVAADPTNGWSYDATTNTLTFHGAACDQIKAGGVTDIDVVFGCAQPVPE